MLNWNVVVTLDEHSFSQAYLLLEELGTVYQSDFENVLLMKVESIPLFLETFNDKLLKEPSLAKLVSRIVPVTANFSFQSSAEFEIKAKEIVLNWLPTLAGKKFSVRMHRRGFKGLISSEHEAGFLDQIILEELQTLGNPGQIDLEDPDAIVAVETVSQQAGLSCWTRQDWQNYPWLRLNRP